MSEIRTHDIVTCLKSFCEFGFQTPICVWKPNFGFGFQTFHKSVWNPYPNSDFRHFFRQCLKSKLFGHQTVKCLKSKLVRISDFHCMYLCFSLSKKFANDQLFRLKSCKRVGQIFVWPSSTFEKLTLWLPQSMSFVNDTQTEC